MIPKPLDAIEHADLRALIDNGVRESKSIEYKRELPGNANSEKVPFLAAISSFANTGGGDLLLGVEEEGGLPTAFPGLDIADIDREKLRLEQIMSTGLEPRLPRVDVHPVELDGGRHVLVVRVAKSWVSPHRVRKNDRFYGRNSAGKYPFDVGELRTAFTLSETVAERIRNFRADRVAKVYGGETPAPLRDGGRMVFHMLPLTAFTDAAGIDVRGYYESAELLRPVGSVGGQSLFNLDGVVTVAGEGPEGARAYTQVYRTGAIEAVSALRLRDGPMYIPSTAYEQHLMAALRAYLDKLVELGVEPPVYVFLSFVGVRGCRFAVSNALAFGNEVPPLEEDVVLLPEVVVEQGGVEPHRVLRPLFDMVWNAFGFTHSHNYDAEGNWTGQR